ncbi:putative hydrogenase [Trypanosoma cruzi]|uniref:Hydrogenase, putative n=2 Tax=Trypanosoma cruzi TaxID=5693 RepID=Q4D686_TRYCC|nr:hydrogenase, putative [Trypanosoma cruzi]EAN88045.1 hydrogenase, putative [Trypanosoma cruzi]PWV03882.1 putative hydrogenase [Trypanosoma cruzi]RNC47270.1 putative hydrogenase [Trypanosoma cruzi]|eukprot:XP_809896.1 hydrogenase [Trypanosoma cruzi strain CL Brener]
MSTSNFSASLMLAGMDYIAPSEACTLPTRLQRGADGSVQRHASGNEVVKITLQDCLACSGCVTTAETILVTSQSRAEIIKVRASELDRPFLVTISDQSAASIAAHLKVDSRRAFHIISGFFRTVLKSQYVSDLRWAQHISVEKTAQEYCHRLQHARDKLPMIVSACPGWVCYCEKQGSAILPLLCPVMSPQGIAGCYAKRVFPQLCHISVQPCFDRKLEAARDTSIDGNERYTDFVLSTQELMEWMMETDASIPWEAPLNSSFEFLPPPLLKESSSVLAANMEGSGGYHRFAMQYVAENVHNLSFSRDDILYEMKRNANHHVATSPSNPGEVYCVAYGFQHIQNIVRGLKRKLASVSSYTFIELMACPDGCLNGGGQVRSGNLTSNLETIAAVKAIFGSYLFSCVGQRASGTESRVDVTGAPDRKEGEPLCFSLAAFREVEKRVGTPLWCCVFHDRQQEFEATLNNGGVRSLKW